MTADVGLVLFFYLFRSEKPLWLKIAYLWKSPFPLAAAAPGCQPNYYHLKEKVHSSGVSVPLYGTCGLMFSPISLRELGGDRDYISVHEPASVQLLSRASAGMVVLGVVVRRQCIDSSVRARLAPREAATPSESTHRMSSPPHIPPQSPKCNWETLGGHPEAYGHVDKHK